MLLLWLRMGLLLLLIRRILLYMFHCICTYPWGELECIVSCNWFVDHGSFVGRILMWLIFPTTFVWEQSPRVTSTAVSNLLAGLMETRPVLHPQNPVRATAQAGWMQFIHSRHGTTPATVKPDAHQGRDLQMRSMLLCLSYSTSFLAFRFFLSSS